MNTYSSNRQEVRLKFQWIGIDAAVLNSYSLNDKGRLEISGIDSASFSLSDTALQLRYRYQLAPLSDVFLVYSRGGFYGTQTGDEGAVTLFESGWRGVNVESLIFKVRYRF